MVHPQERRHTSHERLELFPTVRIEERRIAKKEPEMIAFDDRPVPREIRKGRNTMVFPEIKLLCSTSLIEAKSDPGIRVIKAVQRECVARVSIPHRTFDAIVDIVGDEILIDHTIVFDSEAMRH